MKHTLLFTLALLFSCSLFAQVGIGTTTPDASALLELESEDAGLLIPRMSMANRDAIASPARGLLIYQTDNTPGFYYFNGTIWLPIGGADEDWTINGNDIYNANTGNVGIGNTAPTSSLHITGVAVPSGEITLLKQGFEAQTVGDVNTATGAFPYQDNNNTGCDAKDGWRISTSDNTNSSIDTCVPCDDKRAIIEFSNTLGYSCVQDATLVVGSFMSSQADVSISFDWGFEIFSGTDSFTVMLYDVATPSNSITLINTSATAINQSFSNTQTITPSVNYEIRVTYTGNYDYGATIDNFLVTEPVVPSAVNYMFRLDDGQQQDGYVMTSDANGNATWKELVDDTGSDDQTLTYNDVTKELSILRGNSITLSHDWKKSGNLNTVPGTDFIGTRDARDFVFKTNNLERLRLTVNGALKINNTSRNIFIGNNAGDQDNYAIDHRNIAIGESALFLNGTATDNTVIGDFAMSSSTDLFNSVAIGNDAFRDVEIGDNSVAIGKGALSGVLISNNNTAVGVSALGTATTGLRNTALGFNAGDFAEEDDNVFIGNESDQYNHGGQNVVIGSQAGLAVTTGTPNYDGRILIGYQAGLDNTNSNILAIENSGSETPLIGGDFSNNRVGINVDISNTSNLTHTLTVNGSVKVETLINLKPSNAPLIPAEGDVYYDSTLKKVRVWTGLAWENLN